MEMFAVYTSLLFITGLDNAYGVDLDTSSLIYIWPLCNKTMAVELRYQTDAERPKKGSCPLLDVGPPVLGFSVFLFNNDPTDVVTIRTKVYTGDWDDFSLVFMIWPEAEAGVILEYVAEKFQKDTVHSITVELNDGFLFVKFRYDDGTDVTGMSSDRIKRWNWTVVVVCRTIATGLVTIQTGLYVQETNVTDVKARPLNGAGRLSLSYSSDPLKTAFLGRLCCMAMFTSSIPPYTDPQDITAIFKENRWPRSPPAVKSPCPVGKTYDGPTVLKLWPLRTDNASSFGYDVVEGLSPVAPADYSCFRSRDIFDFVSSPVGYFDGSRFSFLSMLISQKSASTDITVAIFVRPDPPVEGVLWEYTAAIPKPDVISSMSLRLDAGNLKLNIYNNDVVCASLTGPRIVPPNQWSLIYMAYSVSSNNVTLFVNTSSTGQVLNCARCSALTLSGAITVGQGENQGLFVAGYHGSAACLTVFQGLLGDSTALSTVRERCLTLNKVVSVKVISCDEKRALLYARFSVVSENSAPDVGLKPIGRFNNTRSLVDCTSRCKQLRNCRSLTYKKNKVYAECNLYDYVTNLGLKNDTGSRYYVLS